MEINRKILKAGIVLIALLVVIGYVGVYLLTLKEPVFIEHYIEEQIYTGHQQGPRQVELELNYIANAWDNRVVSRVDFPEHPEIQVPASEYGMHGGLMMFSGGQQGPPGNVKGRYSMRTVYLNFTFEEDYGNGESIEITEALVHFSDGSVIETEIGSVNFHFNQERTEALESQGGSGSGPREIRAFSVMEDIELVGVESPILPMFENDLVILLNDRDYREIGGMNLEAGESLLVESNISRDEVAGEKLRYLKFQPKLRYISESGKEETRILSTGWHPVWDYDFIDIFEYLQERGAL